MGIVGVDGEPFGQESVGVGRQHMDDLVGDRRAPQPHRTGAEQDATMVAAPRGHQRHGGAAAFIDVDLERPVETLAPPAADAFQGAPELRFEFLFVASRKHRCANVERGIATGSVRRRPGSCGDRNYDGEQEQPHFEPHRLRYPALEYIENTALLRFRRMPQIVQKPLQNHAGGHLVDDLAAALSGHVGLADQHPLDLRRRQALVPQGDGDVDFL